MCYNTCYNSVITMFYNKRYNTCYNPHLKILVSPLLLEHCYSHNGITIDSAGFRPHGVSRRQSHRTKNYNSNGTRIFRSKREDEEQTNSVCSTSR